MSGGLDSAIATVVIDVPASASQSEQYAVVWAEFGNDDGNGVRLVNRVGIRVYLSIGSGDEPASDFVVDTLAAGRNSDGEPLVRARVENTGGRALDLQGELNLTNGPGGLSAGPFTTPTISTLGIGGTAPIEVPLDPSLPAGPWLATMTMSSGLIERVVEAEITFPDEPEPDPDEFADDGLEEDGSFFSDPVEARPVRPGGPVGPAVAGLFLLLTALLLFLAWRRKRVEDEQEGMPSDTAPSAPAPEPDPTPGASASKRTSGR